MLKKNKTYSLTMFTKVKIILISILTFVINILYAQKNQTLADFKGFPSFRIKTELVSFTGLNPNIYVEYKNNNGIAFNLGFLYHLNGIIWTAPYLLHNDEYENIEWWELKGLGVDFGIKYYPKQFKYYSLKIKYDLLKFNGKLVTNGLEHSRPENVVRNDLGFQLLKGYEFYNKHFLKEIYFGIGLLIINKKYTYWNFSTNPLPPHYNEENGIKIYAIPTFHFGFNIGYRFYNPRSCKVFLN